MRSEELALKQVETFKLLVPVMAGMRKVPNWTEQNIYELLADVFLLGLHLGMESVIELADKGTPS